MNRETARLTQSEIQKVLKGALFVPIAAVVILGGLFIIQLLNLLEISSKTQANDDVIRSSVVLERLLVDSETGMRGYLVRRELEFLEPYESSIDKIVPAMEALNKSVGGDNRFKGVGMELKSKFTFWRQFAESQISYMKRNGVIEPLTDPRVGKKLMDSMRTTLRNVINEMSADSKRLREETDARTKLVLVLTTFSSALVGLYLAFYVRKKFKEVGATYSAIISQLNLATNQLQESHADLEVKVAQRTAALTATNQELEAFCYSVSHDLRAPLRGIDGFSQALLEDYAPQIDNEGQMYLKYVREGVQRMGKLIDDLLALSRLSRVEMRFEEVDVTSICENIMARLQLTDSQRKVHFHVEPGLKLHGDSGLLTAAFENLLSNAWKFTSKKENGQIRIFTSRDDNGQSCIVVEDNGAGFDMKYVDKLFGAFQRLHSGKDFEGTGVGLATVRRIFNRHGFEIQAHGVVGEGARFTIGERQLSSVESQVWN